MCQCDDGSFVTPAQPCIVIGGDMISRDEKSAPSELYDLLMDGGWMDVLQQHPTPQVITKNRKIIFINSAAVNLFDGINIE